MSTGDSRGPTALAVSYMVGALGFVVMAMLFDNLEVGNAFLITACVGWLLYLVLLPDRGNHP